MKDKYGVASILLGTTISILLDEFEEKEILRMLKRNNVKNIIKVIKTKKPFDK